MTKPNFIYTFENGDGNNKLLLGGKGANLCVMTQLGLDVPPGFVITTEACLAYLEHHKLPDGLMADAPIASSSWAYGSPGSAAPALRW
jgi:pyruvate,orthophosphate dikinase